MELRFYVSLLEFIEPINHLEKLQGKMVKKKMIWDFSLFNLNFGIVSTNYPTRDAEKEKERRGNKTLEKREVAYFEEAITN